MGDSYGAEPSVRSSAHQGALRQLTPRLAIKHCNVRFGSLADIMGPFSRHVRFTPA